MQFGKKTTWQTILYSWPVAIVLLIVVVLLSISVLERFQTERDMAARREMIETEYATLQERQAGLQAKVDYLEAERGIEEELRKNFDVAKPGEQVVVLTGELERTATTAPEVGEDSPWWQFWR